MFQSWQQGAQEAEQLRPKSGDKSSYSKCENQYMNDKNLAMCSVKTEEARRR